MAQVAVDTSVLFAAAYRRDGYHAESLPILRGFDDGTLPEPVVLDYVLAETLDGLTTHAGHEAGVELLDRLERNERFHVTSLTNDGFAAAKALYRRHEPFSFVDACLVAAMRREDIEYLYAFDEDFDRVDAVTRLTTPTDPYDPN